MKHLSVIGIILSICASAHAEKSQLKIITSTPTLSAVLKQVVGTFGTVESLGRGGEDPHYIEAKPSFMVKVRNADLVVTVGLELEKAWMDNVLAGSRNPKVMKGSKGFLELGESVEDALEKQSGTLDRSLGDVHPMGNPHYYLDPERLRKLLPLVAAKLGELMPSKRDVFHQNSERFAQQLVTLESSLRERIQKTKIKSIITYHKTLLYFLHRFELNLVATLEPKPGIPPSTSHIVSLINLAKEKRVGCILNESHFEVTAARRVSQKLNIKFSVVPTEVDDLYDVTDYPSLLKKITLGIESCAKGAAP